MKRSIITIVENLASTPTVRIISDAGSEIWMSKPEIARLLMVYQNTISNNLRAIFKAGILNEKDVIREYRYKKQNIERTTVYYNLEVIISLCYRIRSLQTSIIRKYIQAQFSRKDDGNKADIKGLFNNLSSFCLN